MSAQEDAIKLECRLYAMEYFIAKTTAALMVSSGKPKAEIFQRLDTFMDDVSRKTFPNLDPALSDLASAEMENAIGALVKMQKEIVANLLSDLGRA